ncbi:short subunit dehydrogenase [Kribbella steppae]|uniref:Short subunit dehydrogenase n=1 Tax=Kribbella steppae TaxID=2512223 RepID=A0A4R2GYQ7_9ACTN|nr:short subunit dehydrogenase [Kribbella steppae]
MAGLEALEDGVDEVVDVLVGEWAGALEPAVEDRAEEQVDGDVEVQVVGQLACALGGAEAVLLQLPHRLVQPLHVVGGEDGVVHDLGVQRAHRLVVAGSASKFALEGMSEALAAEAAAFGVKLTIVQPGGYWTDLYSSSTATTPDPIYNPLREELEKQWAEGSIDSEPKLAAEALLKLVASDNPPLRLLLGSMVYDLAFDISRQRMTTWSAWEDVSRAAEKAVPAPSS